jgi:hypothetical protein
MGKKSRRKAKLRAAARMAQRSPVQSGQPVQPVQPARPMAAQVVKPMAETKAAVSSIQSGALTQAEKHQYVVPELKQIAIIAGTLFVILLVLAFILR